MGELPVRQHTDPVGGGEGGDVCRVWLKMLSGTNRSAEQGEQRQTGPMTCMAFSDGTR